MIARVLMSAVFGFVAVLAAVVGMAADFAGHTEVVVIAGVVFLMCVIEIGAEWGDW